MTNSLTRNALKKSAAKRKFRFLFVTILLLCMTLFLCLLTLLYGNTIYPLSTVLSVLQGENIQGATFAINTIRVPRLLAGLFCGLAFGMAGNCFQNLLHNPLASPDIIGITSGSSVAAVFGILVLGWSGTKVSILAVIAGLLVTMAMYLLSNKGSFSGGRLILIGIGIQAILSACVSYLLLSASAYDIPKAMRWLSGSLNGVQQSDLGLLIPVVLLFGLVLLFCGRALSILALGEELSVTLGVNTKLLRLIAMGASVLLLAFATSVSGPISFIAFLAGPISKKLTKTGHSNTLPAGLVGACLVLTADFIGQYGFTYRYPVGVITGILGAPFLILLLIRTQSKGKTA